MRTIWRNIKAFLASSREDRRCLLLAWWGLLGIDLVLRWRPSSLLADEGTAAAGALSPRVDPQQLTVCQRAVHRAASHHLLPMTCLRRVLCLRWLLARRGYRTRVRIGVRRSGDDLEAHAWLEDAAGRVLGESSMRWAEYSPLQPIEGETAD